MQPQSYAMSPREPKVIMPRLVLHEDAWNMIQAYVRTNPDTEINGFCYVRYVAGHNLFFVASSDDVFITEQTVSPHSADASGVGYAKAQYNAVMAGREDELRLQWHKHPHDVYCSPTDMRNIENFGLTGEWIISLVVNIQGEMHARFDAFQPARFGGEMEVTIHRVIRPDLTDRAAREAAELVTIKQPPATVVTRPARRTRSSPSA